MKQNTKDKAALTWISAAAKGKRRFIALLVLIHAILGLSGSGYALLLSGVVDHAGAGNREGFLRCALLMVALVATQFCLRMLSRFLDEYARSSVENRLKAKLFEDLLTRDYAQVTATHSGDWLSRLTSDASIVAGAAVQLLPSAVGTVMRMVTAMVLLVAYAPGFGWLFLIGGSALILVVWALRRRMKQLHLLVQQADSRLRVFLTERLNSMMILRAFEQEDTALKQGKAAMDEHKTARMKRNRFSNMFHSGFSAVLNVVYIFGAVYCGYGILTGQMSYGSFTAVLQLIGQAQSPIASISGFVPRYITMVASAERLLEAEKYEKESETKAVEDVPRFYQQEFVAMGLRDAAFTYVPQNGSGYSKEENRQAIRNLNLEIRKGEYVAFCGPSGCGKSTVLKLLMCLYSLDEGQRYLLTRQGEQPLTAGWRGLFSYVPQGNQLMSGTIREVVTFGDPEKMAQEGQIRHALKVACAEFLDELPGGLDTLLGERGAGLSEGQMQRIAIARAIFSDRPVLLLDEATSALDEDTELRLLDNLRSMTDKTVVLVTHRPAALEIADKIFRFDPDEE